MLIHLKEHYDPRWRLKADGFTAKPIKVNDATVAFYVDQPDLKQFTVEFTLEKWYRAGMAISVLTLLVLLIALRYSRD